MAKKLTFDEELDQLKKYLRSEKSENAKSYLLYPLFQKLFKDKFKIEANANGADVYIEGTLLVEAKTDDSQWLAGFYQALHYQKKFGLAYNTILVIAHKFVGIWRVNKLPETAVVFAHTADAQKAPNAVGIENARKTQKALKKEIQESALYWLEPKQLDANVFAGVKNLTTETYEILNILKNLDSDRLQINTHNFIHCIERMKSFFVNPIDAVHCFYSIVAFWDITATVAITETGDDIRVIGFKGQRLSEVVKIAPRHINAFRKFVESQYLFTNEGSGLTVDYYFSRFDEVLAVIDPEYVKQHGIFFTNDNLSKFALWFVNQQFGNEIKDNFIVCDPAGGSGNLISAWRGKLKHKIISELQPDLLKTIEKRMKADPFHLETGFTIIPKTSEQKGLNFLDCSAEEYWNELTKGLKDKHLTLDKPVAFLLNPPYKNTDENVGVREAADAHYDIHPSILDLTGEDAGRERYLAFLGQTLNLAKHQNQLQSQNHALLMVFTPTSWLLPRPTYQTFREVWDAHFEYLDGIIVTSNEWFKLEGKWPLAFTVWRYRHLENAKNTVKVIDFTHLKVKDLNINWNASEEEVLADLKPSLDNANRVILDNSRGDIRKNLPLIERRGEMVKQTRYDFSHSKKESDYGKLVSGFPLKDTERHFKLLRKCGDVLGEFVGFMDDNTPVRINQDQSERMTNKPDRVWLQLRPSFIDVNLTKIQSLTPDKYGYCAYDFLSTKATFTWFCITKILNGKYPVWANQYDIWAPNIQESQAAEWYRLCCAFILAENRCVVTKFEANNPVAGAPEIFVDNPLCPVHPDNFWKNVIVPNVSFAENDAARALVAAVERLYCTWNLQYCKGQYLLNAGLENEAYFKYFEYADFLTPHSGLIQIRKYAEQEGLEDMLAHFAEVSEATKIVKARLYEMLVEEMQYFGSPLQEKNKVQKIHTDEAEIPEISTSEIIAQIKSHTTLDLYANISLGIKVPKEAVSEHKQENNCFPFLRGDAIKPYKINWNNDSFVVGNDKISKVGEFGIYDFSEKIILGRILPDWQKQLSAAIDNQGFIVNPNFALLIPNSSSENYVHISYLLAFLNSKIVSWFLRRSFQNDKIGLILSIKMLKQIPIIPISIEKQQLFVRLVEYILFLNTQKLSSYTEQLMPIYFQQIIDGMIYELFFPDILTKYKRNIIEYIGVLPNLNKLAQQEKMEVVKEIFYRLDDKTHKVRTNLFFMDSIPHINIIEKKDENYEY